MFWKLIYKLAKPPHRIIFYQADGTLMITSLEEIGELPFKSPPPLSRETLSRDGLVRKLRGIQKRGGNLEQYYDRFNEVSGSSHWY